MQALRFNLALCLICIFVSGCSGVVQYRRVVVTSASPTLDVHRVSLTVEQYLKTQGYRCIPLRYLGQTYHGQTYAPIAAYGKFRGGEFRIYNNPDSFMLTSWYGYVPPIAWDSAEYHRIDEHVIDMLYRTKHISVQKANFEK
jgi:hypothetical protein